MAGYFTEANLRTMNAARQSIHNALQPVANTLEQTVPSFEGFVLFQQDSYHPDSAAAIAQINARGVSQERLTFQQANVTNRRVDLEVSTLGQTFTTGDYELQESSMNPEQHLVAGLHLPEAVGVRAACVFQIAFSRQLGSPSPENMTMIREYWQRTVPTCVPALEVLHRESRAFPTGSVADAMQLDVPSTPNAFVLTWDTSHSREQAAGNYGKLRYDLTLRGQAFTDIVEHYGGTLMRPTGDGQSFALPLSPEQCDRLSDISIRRYATQSLMPLVRELLQTARQDGKAPVRFSVELGRIEPTTFDLSSPALFSNADVDERQPRDRVTIDFGARAIKALGLDNAAIAALNA